MYILINIIIQKAWRRFNLLFPESFWILITMISWLDGMDSLTINSVPVRSVPVKASYCSSYKDLRRTHIDPHISYEELLKRLIQILQLDICKWIRGQKWVGDRFLRFLLFLIENCVTYISEFFYYEISKIQTITSLAKILIGSTQKSTLLRGGGPRSETLGTWFWDNRWPKGRPRPFPRQ